MKINVFPTVDLTGSAGIQEAVRSALFGPSTKIFPGGWSFYQPERLSKAPILPVKVASATAAFETAAAFMKKADQAWKGLGQESDLFPLNEGYFRLVPVEAQLLKAAKRPLAWKISWLVFCHIGRQAERPDNMETRFAPVDQALISFTVGLTGHILEGSATWRPTRPPVAREQKARPSAVAKELSKQRRAEAHAGHADPHHSVTVSTRATTGQKGKPSGSPAATASSTVLELRYSAGDRSEFSNFLDPRLRLFATGSHGHGPPLIIPMTDYGLNAEIISIARRSKRPGRDGMVELHAWVTDCTGAIVAAKAPRDLAAHWTVRPLDAFGPRTPYRHIGFGPLRLRGLAEVAFTVRNSAGCIAHAHTQVCSFPDQEDTGALQA
ncbi:MAG: hypothetical protein Tsb0019_02690 [Roseibium sp.]